MLDHAGTARSHFIELRQHLCIHGLAGVSPLGAPHITDQQPDACHGGLQLMGCVSNKAALLIDGRLQPLQQRVGMGDEFTQLLRHLIDR